MLTTPGSPGDDDDSDDDDNDDDDNSEENVALHQPSLQSGSFLDNLPHLAVDGGEWLAVFQL